MDTSNHPIEQPSISRRISPRLVFVVGSGHSGSTLLSMMLGAHPEVLALSEISYFDRWIGLNDVCNCGVPVRSCPLWSKVVARISARRCFSPSEFASEFPIDFASIFDRALLTQRLAHL